MRNAIVVVVAVLTLGVGFAPAATPKRANLASIARELVKSGARPVSSAGDGGEDGPGGGGG